MLELLLLRHAKAVPAEASENDAGRPLTGQGRKAAQVMGRVIAARSHFPDLVLCSSARRARETWDIVSRELTPVPPVRIEDAIHNFGDGRELLRAVATGAGTARRVMLVGHNPALENLAMRLSGFGDGGLVARLAKKFPTCALAVIVFNVAAWADVTDGGGELRSFIRPKDVMADFGED